MKAIQLFYIFIASFSLSFILSCIYFKVFGRKRANNSYCKAITLALDNAKDEKFFKTQKEPKLSFRLSHSFDLNLIRYYNTTEHSF